MNQILRVILAAMLVLMGHLGHATSSLAHVSGGDSLPRVA